MTIPDKFPFPLFTDIIDQLRDCEYFTTLDITSGFWHVRIVEKDIPKTAFVTQYEHFEWTVLPFGFKNSPQIFQRIIQNILKKHNLFRFARNYLDDILIFTRSYQEHLVHIELVLKAFIKENIKLKLSKCQFAQSSVKYLGHNIAKNKYSPINDNLISLKNIPKPKCLKDLEKFLGKVCYYYKFIPNAFKILKPLYDLKKKDVKFIWCSKCDNAFETIIKYLCSVPVLAIHDPNKECYLYTDASGIGIGAVLKQIQDDNQLHPIGYFSRKLLDYQKNYAITELEALAIVEAIEFWHHYLYPRKFTIFTDHMPLKFIRSIKKPNSRIFKWSLKLSQYDYVEIKYVPGKYNNEPDVLSRYPVLEPSDNTDHLRIVNLIERTELIENQKQFINELPKHCKLENDLIIRQKDKLRKVFVPNLLENKILTKFHIEFGHIGAKKMLTSDSKHILFSLI